MKLVIVVPSLALGGAERSVLKFIRVLEPRLERIDLLCLSEADGAMLEEVPERVSLVWLGAASSASPALWWRVYRHLRDARPDVVLGWSTYANLVALVATRFLPDCRVVLSERNYVPQMWSARRGIPFRRRLILALMRWLYPRADVITANSQANVKFLRKYLAGKPDYRLLPNVIDVEDTDRRAAMAPDRSLPEFDGPRILALGCLCRQKGFDILLRAMAQVRGAYRWHLVVAGDGPERAALMRQAIALGLDGCVHWAGRANNPFPYYRWADLVVVPSRFEGFPNVPLEAMACGRAVICSDCKTGPRDLTERGRVGVLVPVDDAAALARAIVDLAADPAKCARLGQAARAHVLARYGAESVGGEYARVLGLAE